jgi:hypothetical protein
MDVTSRAVRELSHLESKIVVQSEVAASVARTNHRDLSMASLSFISSSHRICSVLWHHLRGDRLGIGQFDQIAHLQLGHPLLHLRVLDGDHPGVALGTA